MIGMADVIHTDYDLRIAAMDLLEALCSALGVEDAMDVSTRGESFSIRVAFVSSPELQLWSPTIRPSL